jgi:hypothetical protein
MSTEHWWKDTDRGKLKYWERKPTPWSRALFKKLTVPLPVKKFPHFMETEGSLPHSQAPVTYPYPEPHQSYPCVPIPLLKDPDGSLHEIQRWLSYLTENTARLA